MLTTEYSLWVRMWKERFPPAISNKLVDALRECSVIQYPNLHVLLRIALTLPITSCESERSFSQLKLIKTAQRATMSEKRLSWLDLMKINREQCTKLTSESKMKGLVKSFSQLHPRRIKLPFMLSD